MKLRFLILFLNFNFYIFLMHAEPLVVGIDNHSDIGYKVLHHIDVSSCSLQGKNMFIMPARRTMQEFLLPHSPHQSSLILRPAFYVDPKTEEKIYFLDESDQIDELLLHEAFLLWKQSKGKKHRSIKTADDWMRRWIGGDISVYSGSEFAGYLRDQVRINIENKKSTYQSMLSYSKGVFGKLQIEILIVQDFNRPITIKMQVLHGQGGICAETLNDQGVIVGKVERI